MSPAYFRRRIDAPDGRDNERFGSDLLRVVVVHANEVVRTGLATMLESLPGPVQVTLCEGPGSAMKTISEEDADVMILSPAAGASASFGEADARAVSDHAANRGTKVLLLLDSTDRERVFEIATMPCDGILVEESITSAAIGDALTRLRRGDMPVPTTVLRGLLSEVRSLRDQNNGATPVGGSYLTPREQATLELLVQGLSNKQIARRLCISEHGVKRHVANILVKLNCPNRTLAAARAIREGLVDPP